MVEVKWTPQAGEDLHSIVEFIARDSSQYARLLVVDIFQAVVRIAAFPQSGRIVPELNDPIVREVILGSDERKEAIPSIVKRKLYMAFIGKPC